jgi:predicted ATPase
MITQLKIENYKSIQDLTLDVGRVNVLIGENGCGKSNILEAIALAGAARENKLDDISLENRGIRVPEPKLMRSAFNSENGDKNILVTIMLDNLTQEYILKNDNNRYSKWIDLKNDKRIERLVLELIKNQPIGEGLQAIPITEKIQEQNDLIDFIIYSPENTPLRNFSLDPKIEPLGDKGEGLLRLLIYTQHDAHQSKDSELNDIQETLELFGWFDAIKIPDDFSLIDKNITIKDRYLEMPFDQRSANEGFLLVLFYITLVVSKYTPKIFAIDNIDTSLNPKLCTKLIKELTRLAKKYDKQIFLTSHNPAILDGIDLGDEEQRLFVVSRNREGHTRCKRIDIKDKPKSSVRDRLSRILDDNKTYTKAEILDLFDNSQEPLKLSEALLRGYLGGLPKGF